jgi:hypothetical protein
VEAGAITKRLTGQAEYASLAASLRVRVATMPKITAIMLFFALFGTAMCALSAPATARDTSEQLAAQRRPHIVIRPRRLAPGPNAKRYCRSWLQVQHRLSGTVIVPQMVCWWG